MTSATKVDLKRELALLYRPHVGGPRFVDVPDLSFLMIEGKGDPVTSTAFPSATEALYAVAYTLKYACKQRDMDFTVMPLEGLWWSDDPRGFDFDERADWRWIVMTAVPDDVTPHDVEEARNAVAAKRDLPALPLLRFERLHEGLSAQVTHVGPYEEEPEAIRRLHAFIAEHGGSPRDKHHEIYLSDPRRTPAVRWRTILRQPVQAA